MNGGKLFGLVFAAVLLANLATLVAVRLWDAYAAGRLVVELADRPVSASVPVPETLAVAFRNAAENADNGLACEIGGPAGFTRLLYLKPNGIKGFDALPKGAQIRCHIALDERSSTMLTYFVLKSAGTYELSLEKAPCASCRGQDWRWATVVLDPAGHSDYTHFK